MSQPACLILAAGKGTRMRSNLPKVLHLLAGKSMLQRVLDSVPNDIPPLVVIGCRGDLIRQALGDRCEYVEQGEYLGTGHAVKVGVEHLPAGSGQVLIIHGDEPMIDSRVYTEMLETQQKNGSAIVLLTAEVENTLEFGRVVRTPEGMPKDLVQHNDLTTEQQLLREVNLGVYVFDLQFLWRTLPGLLPHPPKGEFYLTDLVGVAHGEGSRIDAVRVEGGDDLMGINDLVQLERAAQSIYRKSNRRLMEQGVRILDSASTFIDDDVTIEADTVIHPFSVISGATRIGGDCIIGPNAIVRSSQIGNGCTVLASTLEQATVGDHVRIGPYAHLRAGSCIASGAEIGNYTEIKNSTIGHDTRIHHFGYIGDADIGDRVNIGAGTVTCNYDGVRKHRTIVEDGAFIGSDTMLRAPVTIGKHASTGAGSVVTHDVEAGTTVQGVPARVTERGRAGEEIETGDGEVSRGSS
ncbi:MAG: bifunctional UDP-N-acetylglucosamine diphosphorylase/glucosamine-1-phosphate N-acetyltransferase GlmU [Chloroflexota bacterium]